jgi:hypothetical protein
MTKQQTKRRRGKQPTKQIRIKTDKGCKCEKTFFGGGVDATYDLNTNDNPARSMVSTRILPNPTMTGGRNTRNSKRGKSRNSKRGKSRNSKRGKSRTKRMTGGSPGVLMGTDVNMSNPIISTGGFVGSITAASTISGIPETRNGALDGIHVGNNIVV